MRRLSSKLAMEFLREKEFRDVFSMILRLSKVREPLVRMATNSRGWSQKALKNASLQSLKDKLFWILCNSRIETILFLANNELLNQDPINEIAVRVLKIKNVYNDERFNNLKRNERKYFSILNFSLFILNLVT